MADPSSPGPVGTPIPASGLAAHTSPSELASASAGTAVLAGAGITGDMIGTTITRSIITITTTPRAELSITATPITAAAAHTGSTISISPAARAALTPPMETFITTLAPRQNPSKATTVLLVAMLRPPVKWVSNPAPIAGTTTADKPEATPRAVTPALAAVADSTEAAHRTAVVAAPIIKLLEGSQCFG